MIKLSATFVLGDSDKCFSNDYNLGIYYRMKSVAVLLTCYNRKNKTLECLEAFYSAYFPSGYAFYIYLTDDHSSDGTAEAVKLAFPEVNLIKGNGNLYWNGGMRRAWEAAMDCWDFDFYLWLNDDTIIEKHAIKELISCYREVKSAKRNDAIIVGLCKTSVSENRFSYGGRNNNGPCIPNGTIQDCRYINGNLILVPQKIFKTIGILSACYTHTAGDIDYGLRAAEAGFLCCTTKFYVATCPLNSEIPKWCDPKIPLKQRFQDLYSVKGLNMKEYILFRKQHWGLKWPVFALKAYCRTIAPGFYHKLKH